MPIPVSCTSCGARLNVPDTVAGKKVKCPKCQTVIAVPAAGAPTAGASPAAPQARAKAPAAPAAAKPPATPAAKGARQPAANGPGADKGAVTRKPAPARAPAPAPVAADEDEGDAGADWENSPLLQHNEFTLKIKGLLQFNIKNRHYRILKPKTDIEIGVADETAPGWILALRMMKKVESFLPTYAEVRESEGGPLVFSITRSFGLPTNRVDIYDANKNRLGYFRTKLFSLLGGFWVYDTDNKEVAEVKAKLGLPPKMLFLSKDGRELGTIAGELMTQAVQEKKIKVGFGRPALRLTVSPEMADEPRIKVLMLAAALSMEFTGVGSKLV